MPESPVDQKPTHSIGPVDVEWRDGVSVGVGWVRIDMALPLDFKDGKAYRRLDRELGRCLEMIHKAIRNAIEEYAEETATTSITAGVPTEIV